jgi:hypothetical protein
MTFVHLKDTRGQPPVAMKQATTVQHEDLSICQYQHGEGLIIRMLDRPGIDELLRCLSNGPIEEKAF